MAGNIAADIVYRNDQLVAFNDIDPQAPTHVLLVPTVHAQNAAALASISPSCIAELFISADRIAAENGLNSYRTVFNTGAGAGQSVFHAHLHLIGGRELSWPPG